MRILNSCKLLGHQIYSEQQSRKLNVVCAFNVVILRDILYEVWQYRLWSFQTGEKEFYLRINTPKGNDWILSFGLMASCHKYQNLTLKGNFLRQKSSKSFSFFVIEECHFRSTFFAIKGQLISKCVFDDFNFFQKTDKNMSHSSI